MREKRGNIILCVIAHFYSPWSNQPKNSSLLRKRKSIDQQFTNAIIIHHIRFKSSDTNNRHRCFNAIIQSRYPQGLISTTTGPRRTCLLYTSDAADERSSVDLGGR